MCGIAGIFNLGTGHPPTKAELEAMIRQLKHRGPDGEGFYLDGPAGLAHARLSIIDVVGGGQPLCNEDGSVWVTFNGEIFNYIELRALLVRAGHVFRTQSDTEVIVHLYEQYGESFVHHLNGQFAVALWDARRRRLVLARDRVGIRPLFYTEAGGRLLFASEIKALFTDTAVPRRLNPQALGELCTYWAPLPPASLFEGVYALPPGHVLTVERAGRILRRYWDWHFPDVEGIVPRPLKECAAGLRALLTDAVRLQTRADVPVGAYVSGGLDSAVIACLLKTDSAAPLRTFSLRFEDAEFDEGPFQRELVRALGTAHTEVYCRNADISAAFPKAVWHAESALLRTAPVPMMLLAQAVRAQGYKVVLTGEGADEVLAGYDLFREARIRRFCARVPHSRLRPRLLQRLYPYLRHSPAASAAYRERFFGIGSGDVEAPYFSHLPRWHTTRRIWRFFSRDVQATLAGWDPLAAVSRTLPSTIRSWPELACDQYLEAHTLLSGYLLCSQGDRPALAHGIEGRFPFLDHRVIEFCNHLPSRYKLMGLKEKFLLKVMADGLVPPAILKRPKQPYRAPDSRSFFNGREPADYVAEMFREGRLKDAGYFDPRMARALFEKCRQGRAMGFADNMAFVVIVSTMLLDEFFVRGRGLENAAPAEAAPASYAAAS